MDNYNFTKGKWKVFTNAHKECDGEEWGWVGLDTFNSKSINKCSIHWSGKEAKANALLISKAPEMLEALKTVIRLIDLIDYDESIVNESNIGEASALNQMLKRIDSLIKEATEL